MRASPAAFLTLALALAAAGCATKPDLMSGATVGVVTARGAGGGGGPRGIADRFTTEGEVVAFVTMKWPEGRAPSGQQVFESRWYHGDELVRKAEFSADIQRSPYNFSSHIFPVALGPGAGRYEVYADGRLLATKSFEIVAPSPETLSRVR